MGTAPQPVVLIVLDGFGVSLTSRGNAILEAATPNLDLIERAYPMTTLQASGTAVGLPWGEAGNSEVGHLTMGAGHVIYHHLPRIIVSIQDGSFFTNRAFRSVVDHVRTQGSALHLLGLTSSGSVHSYVDHLYALLELTQREGLDRVWLHVITDGKDAPPREAKAFVVQLEERLRRRSPRVEIASLLGRFWAMDRDEQWDRIRRAYELLVVGSGNRFTDAAAYLEASYANGVTDEFVEPAARGTADAPRGRIAPGDGLIMFNFREDSIREITEALAKEAFDAFPRTRVENLKIATMTEYEKFLPGVEVAFPTLEVTYPLARVIAAANRTQLHIAETEKYAHVTYFFNGGVEKPFPGEDRILVPSSPVAHFEENPAMQAPAITDRIVERLDAYDFILGNFANADLVGHSGNYQAAVAAVEALDSCIGRLRDAVLGRGGALLITADHGNAEQKINPVSGEPVTEHTTNPVPLYLVAEPYRRKVEREPPEIDAEKRRTGGILIDVAPTVLDLMGLQEPPEMTGKSLLPFLAAQP